MRESLITVFITGRIKGSVIIFLAGFSSVRFLGNQAILEKFFRRAYSERFCPISILSYD